MTSRVFVITLGYHEDHAIRLLTVCSVSKDDEVIALTAKPVVPAVRRAFDSLRTYLLRLGLKEPKLVEVPTDVIEGLSTIAEVFQDGSKEYVLSLSGGMRYLVIYTLITLVVLGRVATIYIYPEGGEAPEIVIPKNLIKVLRRLPSEAELRILREVMKSPGISVEDLSLSIGRSVKTIRNLISDLSRAGLVVRRGRGGGVFLSKLGEFIVKYLSTT